MNDLYLCSAFWLSLPRRIEHKVQVAYQYEESVSNGVIHKYEVMIGPLFNDDCRYNRHTSTSCLHVDMISQCHTSCSNPRSTTRLLVKEMVFPASQRIAGPNTSPLDATCLHGYFLWLAGKALNPKQTERGW